MKNRARLAVNLFGNAIGLAVIALLFANAYGCLVPENPLPYGFALIATIVIAIAASAYGVGP